MGPESDVEKIREIYRAEREADRIVREGEAAARSLVEEAEEAARSLLSERRDELARRSREALSREVAAIEREARDLLERASLRTREWVRRAEPRIDSIAEELLDRILAKQKPDGQWLAYVRGGTEVCIANAETGEILKNEIHLARLTK